MAEQDWLTPATAPSPSPYQNVVAAPAAGPPAYELRPLTLGEILDRTFSLYRSRFWLFAGIAAVAAAVELLAAGTGRILLHHFSKNPRTIATGGIVVAYSADFLYFFIYCVTQAATCFAVAEVYLGKPASIASSLRAVRGKWYAWIGIAMWQSWSLLWVPLAFLIPIFVLIGMRLVQQSITLALVMSVLFFAMLGGFVFGLIAYIRNSLAIPAKVVEGLSVRKSMRRSKTLASGAKWRIFVLLLIIWALFLVAGMIAVPIALVMGVTPAAPHILAEVSLLLVGFVSRSLVSPVLSIGTCLIYFDQRVRREAFDLEFLLGPEQAVAIPSAQDSTPPDFPPDATPTTEAEPNVPPLNLRLLPGLTLLLLLSGASVSAQPVTVHPTGKFEKHSMQQFRDHLAAMQTLVQVCTASAPACDLEKVGQDERIETPAPAAQTFQVRWQWLREALDQSRKAKPDQRTQLMQQSATRLAEMVSENGQPVPSTQFPAARKDVDRILAGPEFASVEQQSWLDRLNARFWLWLERWFSGVADLGRVAPWLGRLLEFLLFGGAAVGLLFFVNRSLQRQRLAISLNSQSSEIAWSRESNDWAAQAETSARAGDWRDAVHCLYWATIVMLEGRRAWRHNPARTPREYVRLLKPGSQQQGALRGLTQIFERLWYGLRDADATDYQRARGFYDNLRDNSQAGAA